MSGSLIHVDAAAEDVVRVLSVGRTWKHLQRP